MQQCPRCNKVYDESEDGVCPYCERYNDPRPTYYVVYDKDLGQTLTLTGNDYEEYKRNHPEDY